MNNTQKTKLDPQQLEAKQLSQAIKIQKLRATFAKYLYEELYYTIQYQTLREQHPELFNNDVNNEQQTIQPLNG